MNKGKKSSEKSNGIYAYAYCLMHQLSGGRWNRYPYTSRMDSSILVFPNGHIINKNVHTRISVFFKYNNNANHAYIILIVNVFIISPFYRSKRLIRHGIGIVMATCRQIRYHYSFPNDCPAQTDLWYKYIHLYDVWHWSGCSISSQSVALAFWMPAVLVLNGTICFKCYYQYKLLGVGNVGISVSAFAHLSPWDFF